MCNTDTDEDIDRDMIRRLEAIPVDPHRKVHEHSIGWHKDRLIDNLAGGSALLLMGIVCGLLEGC